jgi:hypothetical protein
LGKPWNPRNPSRSKCNARRASSRLTGDPAQIDDVFV